MRLGRGETLQVGGVFGIRGIELARDLDLVDQRTDVQVWRGGAPLTRVGAGGDSRVGVPAGAEREYRDQSEQDEGDLAQAGGHATRQFI